VLFHTDTQKQLTGLATSGVWM